MLSTRFALGLSLASLLSPAAQAQPIGWGPPPPYYGYSERGRDPREGRVNAATYVANSANAGALGHGGISVAEAPGTMSAGLEGEAYEAAVVDQLDKAGYVTNAAASAHDQIAELVVVHDVVQPEEPPHNPVSGEVSLGAGNRGSWGGISIAVDASRPLKALIATRIDARIRDKATGELLWEGHVDVVTRDGDKHWTSQAIAQRLAAALFKDFPRPVQPR